MGDSIPGLTKLAGGFAVCLIGLLGFATVAAASSYVPGQTFGTEGSGDGQLQGPYGVDVDPLGNVYVADSGNHRILAFDSAGQMLFEFGEAGTGDDQFDNPIGIALAADGSLWVSDPGLDRLQHFEESGTSVTTAGLGGDPLVNPISITIDSQGQLLVPEAGAGRVQRFDSNGIALASLGAPGTGDGQFGIPSGVAVDPSGNIHVADAEHHRIQTFSSAGEFSSSLGSIGTGPIQFKNPVGLAFDSDSDLFVADTGNQRVQQISPAGSQVAELSLPSGGGGSAPAPWAIAAGPLDSMYVSYPAANLVQQWVLKRDLTLSRAGSGTGTVTSSPANLNCSSSCAGVFDNGRPVTLTARPAAGSTFAGWSGACSGAGTCQLAMNDDTAVTATFILAVDPKPTVDEPTVDKPTVDKPTAPKARITGKPGKKTKSRKARFRFKSNTAGSKFLCRIDRKKFVSCKSPRTYRKLKPGKHTFRVKAKAAGLTGTATAYTWTIKKKTKK